MSNRNTNIPNLVLGAAIAVSGYSALVACSPHGVPDTESLQRPASGANQAVPGELIVQFRADTEDKRVQEILAAVGAQIKKNLGRPLTFLVTYSGVSFNEMARRFANYPEVAHTEPNRIIRLDPLEKPKPMRLDPSGQTP